MCHIEHIATLYGIILPFVNKNGINFPKKGKLNMKTLEERLETAISYSRKTLTEIAESIGLNEKTIRNYKKDGKKIPSGVLIELANECMVSAEWLLTGKGEMLLEEKKKMPTQPMSTLLESASPADRAEIEDFLNRSKLASALDGHISEIELEIIQAYRSLPKKRQKLFYHKIKAESLEYEDEANPEDAKYA